MRFGTAATRLGMITMVQLTVAFVPCLAGATTIDFEAPDLGDALAQSINPYLADGVTFTSYDVCGNDALGLIRFGDTQVLTTGPTGRTPIGSGQHIRADFPPQPVDPILAVKMDVHPFPGWLTTVDLVLYNSADTEIASATITTFTKPTFGVQAVEPVAYTIIESTLEGCQCGAVDTCGFCCSSLAIDNFSFGDCLDSEPPTLSVAASPGLLWPASHALVPVHSSVEVQDDCDDAPQVMLVSIASDEPDQGTGPDDLPRDIQGADIGTADLEFFLRAERAEEGDGRSYTVCYEASDGSGNVTQQCAVVEVPHDRRRGGVRSGLE